jgi:hypothetical protein
VNPKSPQLGFAQQFGAGLATYGGQPSEFQENLPNWLVYNVL